MNRIQTVININLPATADRAICAALPMIPPMPTARQRPVVIPLNRARSVARYVVVERGRGIRVTA
jgi:hypothetical protein